MIRSGEEMNVFVEKKQNIFYIFRDTVYVDVYHMIMKVMHECAKIL
jgi:hypothetical protein